MKKKIILGGLTDAGKTSFKSVVFSPYTPYDTKNLESTTYVEESIYHLYGDLKLNFHDCPGDTDSFMEKITGKRPKKLFENVDALIFVVDLTQYPTSFRDEMNFYSFFLHKVMSTSPDAQLFGVGMRLDKLFLTPKPEKDFILARLCELFDTEAGRYDKKITFYSATIYDYSVYHAWIDIVQSLMPELDKLQARLERFTDALDVHEVALYHRLYFIPFVTYTKHGDPEEKNVTFEKLAYTLKRLYNNMMGRIGGKFNEIMIQKSGYSTFVYPISDSIFIMIHAPMDILPDVVLLNVKNLQKQFRSLENTYCKVPLDD